MKTAFAATVLALLAAPALAQQPTPDDMRAAYEAAVTQRNRAEDGQVEMAVALRKLAAGYEARLETAMQWLQAAQAKAPTSK